MRGHAITLRDRLVAFFAANPDDELTFADVVVKFSVPVGTARGSIDSLRKVGLLDAVRTSGLRGGPLTYRIGPELARMIGRPDVRANSTAEAAESADGA
jgi:hypothetical protein